MSRIRPKRFFRESSQKESDTFSVLQASCALELVRKGGGPPGVAGQSAATLAARQPPHGSTPKPTFVRALTLQTTVSLSLPSPHG